MGIAGEQGGFTLVLDTPHAMAIAEGPALETAGPASPGAIFGTLFRRGDSRAVKQLAPAEGASIGTTRGEALIDRFWGSYVAILPRPERGADIVRAPFGDLACYHAACRGGTMLASDMALLVRGGGPAPRVDWTGVAAHLIAPDLRRVTTCRVGVNELAGGDRLTLPGRSSAHAERPCSLWSPWSFVRPNRQVRELPVAHRLVRDAVLDTVAARTADIDATVLLLSGGLDSSIVAAALVRAGRRCSAVTMVTRDAGGDERVHASAVATHLGIPLHEVVRDPAEIDVEHSAAAGLPYPADRSFTQATLRAAGTVAAATGAGAIVHGGGGDNVFCALQSAAPVADLLLGGRFDRRLLRLTRDIAGLAQVTDLAVLRQAFARLWRAPTYRWPPDLTLLSAAGRDAAAAALRHPWLVAPPGSRPGSAAHIGLLLSALSVVQSPDATLSPPSRALLLNQPVIEACLAVPSWMWFDRGRNRAVARHGFSDMLPEAIAWRRSKGAMNSFMVEVFEAHRARLRSMLLDGRLVASGLVDRAALTAILDDPRPARGVAYARVTQFADVEAWLRSWP
jgi:asparagine synthase (glutamine-hydrolysing)